MQARFRRRVRRSLKSAIVRNMDGGGEALSRKSRNVALTQRGPWACSDLSRRSHFGSSSHEPTAGRLRPTLSGLRQRQPLYTVLAHETAEYPNKRVVKLSKLLLTPLAAMCRSECLTTAPARRRADCYATFPRRHRELVLASEDSCPGPRSHSRGVAGAG